MDSGENNDKGQAMRKKGKFMIHNIQKAKGHIDKKKHIERNMKNRVNEAVAIDCEMVKSGSKGMKSVTRVSLVNESGTILLDKYVKQRQHHTDSRTGCSDLGNGEDFSKVKLEVSKLINGRKLVGHAHRKCLGALRLYHPEELLRDTSKYTKFHKLFGNTPSLSNLSFYLTGVQIQKENSVENAHAAMRLYMLYREEWEQLLRETPKQESKPEISKEGAVALDCEMVGLGPKGRMSSLARVSIVDESGEVLLNKYVKQKQRVTDYRTKYSGIRPADLENGEDFANVKNEVSKLISGRKLVGHALQNDLQVLYLSHPKALIRDTSKYKKFCALYGNATPSLKNLSFLLTGVEIQKAEHDSVEDAQAAMRLYMLYRDDWETKKRKTTPKKSK